MSRKAAATSQSQTKQNSAATSYNLLRGIAFIVDDSDKGPKLVFRYPTTFGTSTTTTRQHNDSTFGSLTSNVMARPISNKMVAPLVQNPFVVRYTATSSSDDTFATQSSYLNKNENKDPFGDFDTDLLAWMFRPRRVMCNQVFELEIDGTSFVSYPIVLPNSSLRLFNVVFAIGTSFTSPSVVQALGKIYFFKADNSRYS